MRSLPFAVVLVALVSGCSSSSNPSKGSSASTGGAGTSTGIGAASRGSVDPSIVGSWYAGRGGTQIAYDQSTGEFGAPSGSGMLFDFHADGTYQKGVQSIESGACTTGYVVVESGVATTNGSELLLHPTKGTMHEYSCSGTSDNEHPTDIADETLTWTLDSSVPALNLVDPVSGNGAAFLRTSN